MKLFESFVIVFIVLKEIVCPKKAKEENEKFNQWFFGNVCGLDRPISQRQRTAYRNAAPSSRPQARNGDRSVYLDETDPEFAAKYFGILRDWYHELEGYYYRLKAVGRIDRIIPHAQQFVKFCREFNAQLSPTSRFRIVGAETFSAR